MVIYHKKHKIMKLIIITFCLLLFGCKQKEIKDSYNLDLSIEYKASFNSFKIDDKGNAFVLITEMSENPHLYNVVYNSSEMKYINESLRNVNFTVCDSLKNNSVDGIRYVLIIKNTKTQKEITVINNICEQQEPLNKLVDYIALSFEKKKKNELFKSFNRLEKLRFIKPDLSEH
jgi:hypothetical protein